MDENQKKQVEIVKKALKGHSAAVNYIYEEIVGLAQTLLKDVTAFEVLQGKSELMLAATALMSIAQQVELIFPERDDD